VPGFRPNPDVLTRRVGDELVLVHMGRNEIFSLNATGARLWELLAEGLSRDEARARLQAEFDVDDETFRDESDRLVRLFEREGLATLPG